MHHGIINVLSSGDKEVAGADARHGEAWETGAGLADARALSGNVAGRPIRRKCRRREMSAAISTHNRIIEGILYT